MLPKFQRRHCKPCDEKRQRDSKHDLAFSSAFHIHGLTPCWAWLRQQLIKRQSVAKWIPKLKISNGFWHRFNLANICAEAQDLHSACLNVAGLEAHDCQVPIIDFILEELQPV